jgi:hypothetical protein
MKRSTLFLATIRLVTSTFTGNESVEAATGEAFAIPVGGRCPDLAPGPISTHQLAGSFPPPVLEDATSIEAIRNTLALYPLAIDGLNIDVFDQIFAADARANYSAPIGVLNGIAEIKEKVPAGLSIFAGTHHSYGTQLISICSVTSAVSVTYYTASHFFTPGLGPEIANATAVLYAYGNYQDTWERQGDGTWRITNRNLVYMVSPYSQHFFFHKYNYLHYLGPFNHRR